MSGFIINNCKIVFREGSCCSHTFSNIFAVVSPAWTLDLDKLVYLSAGVCGGDHYVVKCEQTTSNYRIHNSWSESFAHVTLPNKLQLNSKLNYTKMYLIFALFGYCIWHQNTRKKICIYYLAATEIIFPVSWERILMVLSVISCPLMPKLKLNESKMMHNPSCHSLALGFPSDKLYCDVPQHEIVCYITHC